MKYIELSEWELNPQRNIYHFYRNCAVHVVSYLIANNLEREDVIFCIREKQVENRRILNYFFDAIKQFVSDVKIIKHEENIYTEIIDIKKYGHLGALRKKIESLNLYKDSNKQVKDIIFIKRNLNHNFGYERGVKNEQELINELRKEYKENFIDIYLENYSFEEQVKLMRGCRLLVGCHGAGFANMWWMNAETSIFELFPESFFWGSNLTISYVKQINHYYMHGKDITSPQLTLEQYAKENGLCLHCLRMSSPRDHTVHLKEMPFIHSNKEWKNNQSPFNKNFREKVFEINKDEFMEKIKFVVNNNTYNI
jgi:hypothetical protein